MSLITCPDCKKEISSMAVNCPSCGYPIKNNQRGTKNIWFTPYYLGLTALCMSSFSLLTLTLFIGMIVSPFALYFSIKALCVRTYYKKSAIAAVVISSIALLFTIIGLPQVMMNMVTK